MTSGNYDFFIEKDRTFSKTIQVFDSVTNNPYDLTNISIKMEIRASSGSTVLFTFSIAEGNVSIDDATKGIFSLFLSATESDTLSFTKASYDLVFINNLTGEVIEIIEGYVNVLSSITSSV